MTTKSQKLTGALALLALGLTACGGDGDDGSEETGERQEFVVASSDPVPNLIPGRQTNAFQFTMSVFTSLTFLEEDGELSYLQAESVESEDDTVWTVTLREG